MIVTAVLVIREDDYDHARNLAQWELDTYDPGFMPGTPRFGWWREVIRDGNRVWEEDARRGVPGYWFDVTEKTDA
jgi:hypothetical protein